MVAAVLVLAACKSTGESVGAGTTTVPRGAGGGTTGTSVAVAADPRAPGVTADTIKIGVPYVDLSAIKDVINLDNGDPVTSYQAIVDDINAKGGINGRKLEPIFAPINPVGTAASDAACTKLTQDDPVFVTVGFFLGDGVLCYVDTNGTAVIGGNMTAEALAKAKAPWFSTDPSDEIEADVVRAQGRAGRLDGKLAVVAAVANEKVLNDLVQPVLDDLGIKPVATAILDAPPSDPAATQAAAQTIAEKFKSAGADKVLVVGQSGPPSLLPGLAKTDYRPQFVFSNQSGALAFATASGNDLTLLKGAVTAGMYGPDDDRFALGGPTKECLDVERKAGLEIEQPSQVAKGQPNQFLSSGPACIQMALLKAILQKAGRDLDYGTFAAAGHSLGSIVLPGAPDPFTYGPGSQADGDPKIYVFASDPERSDFVRRDG